MDLSLGHWKGGNKYAGNDLGYVPKLIYYSVCEYTGFSKTELLEGKLFCIAQVVFLIGLCAMLTGLLVRHARNLPSQMAGRMGVVLLYGPVSIGLLIFRHGRTSSGMSSILNEPIGQHQTLQGFLQANCDATKTLLSSMPQITHLFVERPSVGLPTGFYNTTGEPWSFERVGRLVSQFRVKYVLLLTHEHTSGHQSQFFRKLADGETLEWLRLKHSGSGYQLFEVNSVTLTRN